MVIYFDDILIYSSSEAKYIQHLRKVLTVLQANELYINLKKCNFMTSSLIFLGFVIGSQEILVDEEKVRAMRDWLVPNSVTEERSFHDLTTFYRRSIRNFSCLVARITVFLKKERFFLWTEAANEAFTLIKDKLTNAPVLAFLDFKKVFELECNICGVRIGAVLLQENRPIAFLSEKLNEAQQKWSAYEQKLYVVYHPLIT